MIEEYRRDGYVVLDKAVPRHRLMESLVMWRLSTARGTSVEAFRASARLLAMSPEAHRLFLSAHLLLAVQKLGVWEPILQTSPVLHAMGFDADFPGVEAHQDWPALQSGLNTVVCWIPLMDCPENKFPLEVVPGSHRLGLLPSVPGQHISAIDTAGMDFVPVPMKRGQALLFSAFLVHRTRFPGKGTRVALSHRFEDARDPWFVRNGNPSAQSRVIRREVLAAPTVDQVREIFA